MPQQALELTRTHTRTHICTMHTHIHTRTHAHTHMHTRTCAPAVEEWKAATRQDASCRASTGLGPASACRSVSRSTCACMAWGGEWQRVSTCNSCRASTGLGPASACRSVSRSTCACMAWGGEWQRVGASMRCRVHGLTAEAPRRTSTRAPTPPHTHTPHTRTHISQHTYPYTHTHIHTHTYPFTHTQTHTHTHTHTHTTPTPTSTHLRSLWGGRSKRGRQQRAHSTRRPPPPLDADRAHGRQILEAQRAGGRQPEGGCAQHQQAPHLAGAQHAAAACLHVRGCVEGRSEAWGVGGACTPPHPSGMGRAAAGACLQGQHTTHSARLQHPCPHTPLFTSRPLTPPTTCLAYFSECDRATLV